MSTRKGNPNGEVVISTIFLSAKTPKPCKDWNNGVGYISSHDQFGRVRVV